MCLLLPLSHSYIYKRTWHAKTHSSGREGESKTTKWNRLISWVVVCAAPSWRLSVTNYTVLQLEKGVVKSIFELTALI
jgi:hypothetical protein